MRCLIPVVAVTLLAAPLAVAQPPATKPAATKPAPKTVPKAAPTAPVRTPAAPPSTEADDGAEAAIVERFVQVLEKNPRRGTAFDRVYGAYVERGELTKLVDRYSAQAKKAEDDGTAAMILGLIESQRGRDREAAAAFTEADRRLTRNPIASFYLGQSQLVLGKTEEAIPALERAIARQPAPTDLMDVFQTLGRAYQRSLKPEEAAAVWSRMEAKFPGDLRVQEQIAQALLEEGQTALALPRLEKLAAQTKDKYKQTRFKVQVAELRAKGGDKTKALAEFEALLSQLNPDNWLYRDVRRQIEDVFLRSDDQDGLSKYYAAWVEKNPKDVEAIVRLAKVLDGQARSPEARVWLEKALKLAPTRKDLRRALIASYQDAGKTAEVLAQYTELDKLDPNNPDILREWGRVILRDTTRNLSPEQKRAEASTLWKRLLAARPDDPVIITQVADLFRNADLADDALALYRKAVDLAPDSAQYREYLGEYLHQLKRPDEALSAWKEIAAGKRGTAKNLARLAEVYAGFGYLAPALDAMRAAVKADGKELNLRLQAADLYSKAEQYEDALAEVVAAAPLTTTPEEREQVLVKELRTLASLERLTKTAEEMGKTLATAAKPASTDWYRYARFLEADQKPNDALVAIGKCLVIEPGFIPGLATQARLHEAAGAFAEAANVNRALANLDRRYRTEYLTAVSRLEARLGRKEAAIQAARDVIASAPGAPEHYESLAQLCFQLGEKEQGLDALRRLVRANPAEPKHLVTLAQALSDQGTVDEAQQLFWQAFEKTSGLDDRLPIVTSLTNAYLVTAQWDKLLERLERLRRESQDPRDMTICLAQAHQAAGDIATARTELETLFSPDTRDTQLLQQLSTLSENDGDSAGAIRYQETLVKVAPGKETESRLVQLLLKEGNVETAGEWMEKLVESNDLAGSLTIIDNMLELGREELASRVLARLSRGNPDHWELLYREGVALATRSPAEAETRFRRLLALTLDDEPGAREKSRNKPKTGGATLASSRTRGANSGMPELARMEQAPIAAQVIGLPITENYGSQTRWSPSTYFDSRMASWGWLVKIGRGSSRKDLTTDALHKQLAEQKDLRSSWDRIHLAGITQDFPRLFETSRDLARRGDLQGIALCLTSLPNRASTTRRYFNPGFDQGEDPTPPLPKEEVLELVGFSEKLRQAESLTRQRTSPRINGSLLGPVLQELRRAKMTDELNRIKTETLSRMKSSDEALEGMGIALMLEDPDQVVTQIRAYGELLLSEAKAGQKSTNQGNLQFYAQYYPLLTMARFVDNDQPAKVIEVLNAVLEMEELSREANAINTPAARSSRAFTLTTSAQSSYVNYTLGKRSNNSWQGASMTFPSMNGELLSARTVWALRNAFELYQLLEKTPELTQAIDDRIASTQASRKLTAQLARISLLYWMDKRDQAAAELVAIAGERPDSLELKGMLVGLLEETSQFDQALALVESYQPTEPAQILVKNQLVLRLALRTGDTERAREAAEALFGQRLPANELLTLSSQMRRLGMSQQADSVAARVQRQAGRQTDTLVTLMQQYIADNKPDAAAQVAIQLIRKIRPSSRNSRSRTQEEGYRQTALGVLQQLGKLDELIAKSEKQLEQSPRAVELMETLASYYQAAGKTEPLQKLEERILAGKPKDSATQLAMAQRMASSGKHSEACDLYLQILKNDPKLLMNDSWEVLQAFERAKRSKDLADAIDAIDLRQFGAQSYMLSNLIQNMISNSSGTVSANSPAFRVFRKAWAAMPALRGELLGAIYRDEYWSIPEMYDLVREHILPAPMATDVTAWQGLANGGGSMSYHGDGRIDTMITRLVKMASSNKQADQFLADLEKALEQHSGWEGGRVLKALMLFKLGRREQAQPVIEKILERKDLPYDLAWVIAQETARATDKNEHWIGVTDRLLLKATAVRQDSENEFQFSPAYLLMQHYRKTGRNKEARELMVAAATKPQSQQNGVAYSAYRRVSMATNLGTTLTDSNCALEAVYFLASVGDENELRGYIRQVYGGDGGEHMLTSLATVRNKALTAAKQERQAEGLIRILTEGMGEIKSDQASNALFQARLSKGSNPGRMGELIELALGGLSTTPESLENVRKRLDELSAQRPKDLGLAVIRVLVEQKAKDGERLKREAESLAGKLESQPLENANNSGKWTTAQRRQAEQQLPVWLAYLAIANQEETRPLAETFRNRAFDAAARSPVPTVMSQLYREAGKTALEAGNKAEAEALWNRWLDTVTEPALRKDKGKKAAGNKAAERQKPRSAPLTVASLGSPVSSTAPARGMAPLFGANRAILCLPAMFLGAEAAAEDKPEQAWLPLTRTQFEQVMEVARESARAGLHELSKKALARAFSGGAPVPDVALAVDSSSGFSPRQRAVPDDNLVLDRIVVDQVGGLMKLWTERNVPASERYAALRLIVLPQEPKRTIRLFIALDSELKSQSGDSFSNLIGSLLGVQAKASREETSLGELLGREAVAAGKKAELFADLAALETQTESKVASLTIKVAAAVASDDGEVGKAALKSLLELARNKGTSQGQLVEATLAGMRAIRSEALREDATALIAAAAPRIAPLHVVPDENQSLSPQQIFAQRAVLLMTRYQPKGATASNDAALQSVRAAILKNSSRYRGDSVMPAKARDFKAAAGQLVAAGRWRDALELYGDALDADALSNSNYGSDVMVAVPLLVEVDALPAAERYALLKAWTFPVSTRKTLRVMGGLMHAGQERLIQPKRPLGDGGSGTQSDKASPSRVCATTLGLLVESAKEAGQLDELSGEVLELMDAKVPGAELLMLLCDLKRGAGAAQRTTLQELPAAIKTLTGKTERRHVYGEVWSYLAVAMACLEEPAVADLGQRLMPGLIDLSISRNTYPLTAFLRERLAVAQAEARQADSLRPGRNPGLAHWVRGGRIAYDWYGDAFNYPEPFWLGTGDVVGHVGGQDRDHLLFRYPLEGTFEFSVDTYLGAWSEGNIGYAGIEVDLLNGGQPVIIQPVSHSESLTRPDVPDRGNEFNRLTVRVTPETVTYLTNGQVAFTQKAPARTSPWLMLHTWGTWKSVWKNARISGSPVIPRSVSLIAGGRLDGWSGRRHNQTLPSDLKRTNPSDTDETEDESMPFWRVEGGRLVSMDGNEIDLQNQNRSKIIGRLSYVRPLLDGETLKYTYRAGQRLGVYPALGETAYLIKPEGVSLYALPRQSELLIGVTGSERPASNARMAAKSVSLSTEKENVCELSLAGEVLTIRLNGETILEQPLEARSDRTFSFITFPEEMRADIGDVTLSGNWPETLTPEVLERPFALEQAQPLNVVTATSEIIGDRLIAGDPFEVVYRARQMEATARYEFLKEWVLPGPTTGTLRMQGSRTPRDPAGPVAAMALDAVPGRKGARVQSGGELVAPVVELVRTAKQLKKLKELTDVVKALPDTTPMEQRAKRGLMTLVAVAQGNTADVLAAIKAMAEMLAATDVKEPEEARWIELLVAIEALESPETRYDAYMLLGEMALRYRVTWDEYNWTRAVMWARTRADWMVRENPLEELGRDVSSQWQHTSATRAESRGRGWGQSGWMVRKGEAIHQPGHAEDYLYFAVPLRGDFEVTCDVTSFGYREMNLMYGGRLAMLRYDEKTVEVGALDGWRNENLPEQIPVGDWYELKLKVSGGTVVWVAAGKEIYREELGANADPWLAIHSAPINNGGVRNLRITGQPVIPETVELAIDERLTKWRPSYFSDSMEQNESAVWRMGDPGEIISPARDNQAARETWLRYHRPAFEDGVFSYEFFHEEGPVAVAATLDRLAFVLEKDNVRLHWITDGPWDRTGLPVDNLIDEPGLRVGKGPLPLKVKDWNQLELVTQGDQVEIRLNGEPVARRAIEATNQRHLGLFRFTNWPAARVRKTSHTGAWPKALPPVAEQILAGQISDVVRTETEPPLQTLTIDFRKDGLNAQKAGVDLLDAPADGRGLRWTKDGLDIEVPPQKGRKHRTAVSPKVTAIGDFEYTATFSQLRIKADKASPGRGVELGVDLLSPSHRAMHVGLIDRLRPGLRTVTTTHVFDPLVGDRKYGVREWDIPTTVVAGRLKSIRKGSVMTSFFAADKATTWIPIESIAIGRDDVRQFRFQVGQWDETSIIGARLEKLEIKAETLLPRK